MQEILLLALISALSPVSIQCTDQEEIEEVEEVGENEEDVGGQDEESAPENMSVVSQNEESTQSAGSETSYSPDDSDFFSNRTETGTKSIFDSNTFEATEGVQSASAA